MQRRGGKMGQASGLFFEEAAPAAAVRPATSKAAGEAVAGRSARFPWWGEAYVALDAQLRAVELLAMRADDAVVKAYVERQLLLVDGARDALFDLHRDVADAQVEPYHDAVSPILAYIYGGHLWCCGALAGLWWQAARPHELVAAEAERLEARSSAYVASRLAALYQRLVEACDALDLPEHRVERLASRAADAHDKISGFRWNIGL